MSDWTVMLDELRDAFDAIEGASYWERRFVENMLSLRESSAKWEPSERQSAKIGQMYTRYCRARESAAL